MNKIIFTLNLNTCPDLLAKQSGWRYLNTAAMLVMGFLFLSFSVLGQNIGDYQTAQSGDWNDVNTWERYNGATWEPLVPGTPSFPTVLAQTSSVDTDGGNTHTISLPSGIQSGDLLLILFADSDDDSSNPRTPTGFSTLSSATNSGGPNGRSERRIWYKIADGTEGATVTSNYMSGGEPSAHTSYRIATGTYQGIPVAGSVATGIGTMPNPPSLTPAFSSSNTLWIAASQSLGDDNSPTPSAPANYSNLITAYTGSGTSHARVASARRELSAATENPGTFILGSSVSWAANTIAIQGTFVGGDPLPSNTSSVVTILSGHIVTVTASVSVDEVTVETGAQINVNSGQTLAISDGTGTDLTVNGTLLNAGTVTTTGTVAFGAGATYIHDQNGGTIPTGTWDAESNCNITGVTNSAPSNSQAFGNLTWNCTGQTGDVFLTNVNITGDFNLMSSGSPTSRECRPTDGSSHSIGGNYNHSGGTIRWTRNNAGSLTVTGNVTISGGECRLTNGNSNGTMTVGGDFNMSGGLLTETGSANGCEVVFPTGIHNCTGGGTISSVINFTVDNGATLTGNGTIGSSGGTTTSHGVISPGNSTGTFTINGPFTNASDATIEIEITGTSGDNDVLAVNGAITLAGTMNVTLLSGAVDNGDSYIPVTWSSRLGTFTTVNLPGVAADWLPTPTYNAGNLTITYAGATLVPINLLSFTGKRVDKTIELNWTTATEQNNDYMAVERAADGIRFSEIGRVAGVGTTTETQHYAFTDEAPLQGANYYRLRQVDF